MPQGRRNFLRRFPLDAGTKGPEGRAAAAPQTDSNRDRLVAMGAEYVSGARRTLSPFSEHLPADNWRTPRTRGAWAPCVSSLRNSRTDEREARPTEADGVQGTRRKNSPKLKNPHPKRHRPWPAWGRAPPSSRYPPIPGLPTYATDTSSNLYSISLHTIDEIMSI